MDVFTARSCRIGGVGALLSAMAIVMVLLVDLPAAHARQHPDTGALLGADASGVSVRWTASPGCLNAELRRLVGMVAASFGYVTVNSTCRSRQHNAAVGGAGHSYHLGGNAVDFTVNGDVRKTLAFLNAQRTIGGLKHYRDGHFHIDTGPRRTW